MHSTFIDYLSYVYVFLDTIDTQVTKTEFLPSENLYQCMETDNKQINQ